MKLNAIVKIRKYKGLHEGHHFILMPMEVMHLGVMWIVSSRSVLVFSTINDREIIYRCLFAFSFSGNVLVFFLMCFSLYYKEEDCVGGRCLF